jgi:hypothetical protein
MTSLVFAAILATAPASGQIPGDSNPSQVVCRHPDDTSQDCYRLYGPRDHALGLVALLPAYGGGVDDFAKSSLPARLAEKGVATIVVAPTPKGTGYLDEAGLDALHATLRDAARSLGLPPRRIVIGGFSAGGVGAVRHAQRCAQGRCDPLANPVAVFGVDPPLDLDRWARAMQLIVQRGAPKMEVDEAAAVLEALRDNLGGTPDEVPEAYRRVSPLLARAPRGGNAALLADRPVRLYTEPDVPWMIDNALDYYTTNAIDQVAMISTLRLLGNPRAEIVVTSGRGYREDLGGRRLPHSWSIVDEADLARWILSALGSGR